MPHCLMSVALVLVIFSPDCFGQKPTHTLEQFSSECTKSYRSNASELSFEYIRHLIEDNKVKDGSDFVLRFEKDPILSPLLSSYVLIHSSRSSQADSATADYPRMVFFIGNIIVATTGHPEKPNRSIEIIEYEKPTKSFNFNLIDFSRDGPHFYKNPEGCVGCHGDPPLPIWPSYRTWPGAYTNYSDYFSIPNPALKLLSAEERDKKHKRYILAAEEGRFPRKGSMSKREFDDLRELFGLQPRRRTGPYASLKPTNSGGDATAFNHFLNRHNFDRIHYEITRIPAYPRYQYATVGALLKCPDLPEFLGSKYSEPRKIHDTWLGLSTFDQLIKRIEDAITLQHNQYRDFATRIKDEEALKEKTSNDTYDAPGIAGLHYLLKPLSVNVDRFSLNFSPGSNGHGFSQIGAGYGGLRLLVCRFIPNLVRTNPSMGGLLEMDPTSHKANPIEELRFCPSLKSESLRAFGH